jgi:hypothetical protein
MKLVLPLVLLLGLTSANAQAFLPNLCPMGFLHRGGFCVGQGHRLPYSYFARGGRYFGMRNFRNGRPVVIGRPGIHRPGGPQRPLPLQGH